MNKRGFFFFKRDVCGYFFNETILCKNRKFMLRFTVLQTESVFFYNQLVIPFGVNKIEIYLRIVLQKQCVVHSGCSVARSSRLLWEQEVAGSNPATPTKTTQRASSSAGQSISLLRRRSGVRIPSGSLKFLNPCICRGFLFSVKFIHLL